MRAFLTLSFMLATTTLAQADEKKSDLKKMQGTWLIVKEQFGERKISEEELKKLKPMLTIKDSTFTVTFNGKPLDSGKLKLDETKAPRTVDSESKNGTKMKGVYEIKGDTMTVVFAPPGKDRPKAVGYEKGTQQILIVYQRQK